MERVSVYRNSTEKPLADFVADLSKEVEKRGFGFYHPDKSDLGEFYRAHGVDWPTDYEHRVLQLCKPENSGKALQVNPERSVLVQKFFFVFNRGGRTEIRFLRYSQQLMADLLGHNEYEQGFSDDVFAERMAGIFSAMQASVEAAV